MREIQELVEVVRERVSSDAELDIRKEEIKQLHATLRNLRESIEQLERQRAIAEATKEADAKP